MSDLERGSHEKVKQCFIFGLPSPMASFVFVFLCAMHRKERDTAPYFKRMFSLEVFPNYL